MTSSTTTWAFPPRWRALKESDIPALARAARHEAHTGYPVPRYMSQQECEDLIRRVLPPPRLRLKKRAAVRKAAPKARKKACHRQALGCTAPPGATGDRLNT